MAPLDLRVRLLGWGLRRVRATNVVRMRDADIVKAQQRHLPHNPLFDAFLGGLAPGVVLDDRAIPGPAGEIPVRVYRPEARAEPAAQPPVVLYLHGGGWTIGNLDVGDWVCRHVAARVGAAVVSVAYRLAPANRFPAAVEDAYASAAWFAGHGDELGADGRRLAVMGDSAGGNLAAVVCLAARDRGGPAIRHQTLVYPCTDLTLASPSMASNAHAPLLTADEVRVYVDHYLGPGADRSHPYASPLLAADHSGLPPALVQVAEHDPIRDDGRRYAEALRDAGVPVRLTEYVGMPHGYITLPGLCRSAGQALAEICQELSGHLA